MPEVSCNGTIGKVSSGKVVNYRAESPERSNMTLGVAKMNVLKYIVGIF